MLLDGGFNNRQPQTCTARFTIACFIGTIERAENLLAIFRANAGTIVIHRNGDAVFIYREAYFNLRIGITQGITNNVFQRTFQSVRVAIQRPRPSGS